MRPADQSAHRRRADPGGVAHGVGNALFEAMSYDDGGQPLTTTFADYLLPIATDVPT